MQSISQLKLHALNKPLAKATEQPPANITQTLQKEQINIYNPNLNIVSRERLKGKHK